MVNVLISIRPQHVQNICEVIGESNGKPLYKKTIEVRKTKPKLQTPFKCLIYCTKGKPVFEQSAFCEDISNGKVIGEFVCDKIDFFFAHYSDNGSADLTPSRLIYGLGNANSEDAYLDKCCLTHDELFDYIISGKSGSGFGWHITDLKIYDKPKELSEFFTPMGKRPSYMLECPPQSWCYVEELQK